VFEFSELPRPVIRHLNGLWRRRWNIAAVAGALTLMGWTVLLFVPDKYESRAHIFIQTETILEPVFNGFTARPNYEQRVEVMRLQLLTRPNLEEVIHRAGLDQWKGAPSGARRRANLESTVRWMSDAVKIESPREMYFVISFKHKDPEMSRAVVDATLNLLIEQDLGASLTENEAARRRLHLQIEEYEEKLTANEGKVAEFRSEHAVDLVANQGAARRRELKEDELARAGEELARVKGRVVTLENLLSATPRTTSGDELDKLRVELADLRSKYKEIHPDIKGVVARIEQLERGAGGALSSNPEYIRLASELRVARESIGVLEQREEKLREELGALDLAAGQAPVALAQLQQIERQYETTKKTYEELLQRRDRLDLTENLGAAGRGVEYRVFERPERAVVPSDPPRLLLIAGVLILAAGAGVGAGMLMTAMDKSYTQASELQEAFGLPVLGVLSQSPSQAHYAQRRRDLKRLSGAAAALLLVGSFYAYWSVFRLPAAPAEIAGLLDIQLRTGGLLR
jgi:polysaccharide chain length determinant protein (PEP-CTERM system associated)